LYSREYARGVALFAGGSDLESMSLWYNFDNWYNEALTSEEVGLALCPDSNYIALYKKTFNALVSSKTTCISPVTAEYNGIVIEGKTWKQAFSKGIIEGLLVYPISWLLYTFTIGFSNGGIALGAAAMLSILVVTIIVRLVLILLTFKQTLSQQKMTALQPEIVKIQNKYPNAQTNEYEKQKLAQEQMALYKKNHVSPFGMFIVLLIQFPIFIAVWSAMQGSSILMSGEIFGLSLASSTGSSMINFKGPWYVAWVVFILMAAAQFLSMKIPQWHQKKKAKSYEKVGKNPTQDQQSKTNNMVSNIMVIMIILMGLQLPIAMSVYWFIGALISLLQSLIMQHITEKQAKKKSYKK
jgi:YidC/Oxa1 family membrane protein insertase